MNSKLLRHPQPYAYESLSNYMHRLSECNFCDITWLDDCFKIHSPAKTLDKYNIYITPESMNLIAEATGLSIDKIIKMTINRFNLWDLSCNYFYQSKELSNFTILKQNYFCPICLKESSYEKIYWKLNVIKVCLTHHVMLIKQCTNCGREITYKEFIDRKCSCGINLEDMQVISIKNAEILKNQYRLYKIFSISDISNKYEGSDIVGITIQDYAKFLYALHELSMPFIKKLKENKFIELEETLHPELEQLLVVEKVLEEWPHNFYIFIDLINKFEHAEIILKEDELRSWQFSPLSFLYKPYHRFNITRIHIVNEYLNHYFYMRYNYETFHELFTPIVKNSVFIEERYVRQIFLIPDEFIKLNFNIYREPKNERIRLLDLREIIGFFNQYIKGDNFIITREDRSIDNISTIFHGLNVTLNDIFYLVSVNKIEVKINPLECGIAMLYVPEKEMKIAILKFILNALENGDN